MELNNRPSPGGRFGRLTAIEEAPRQKGRRYWRCLCDCGREKTVEEGHLRSGHTKSCGCLSREQGQARAMDLTGRRFGRLTVLERCPQEKHRAVTWLCRCDCGGEVTVEAEYLLRARTRSCGCLREEQRRANMEAAIHFSGGTCIEKIANPKESAANTSGHRGVTRRGENLWRAEITFRGKRYHLGYYRDFEEAVKARLKGEEMFSDYLRQWQAGNSQS